MENAGLYERLDFNAPYNYPDASTNTQNNLMMKTFEPTHQCPTAEPNQLVTCCTFLLSSGPYHVAQANYSAIPTHTQDIFAKLPIPENTHTGVMYLNSATQIRDIEDGTSQTFLVGETITYPDDLHFNSGHYCPNRQCYAGHFWAAENAITTGYGINSHTNIWDMPASGLESAHPGGAQFLFADGHVVYISQDISQSILNALTTRAGREDVGGEY